MKAATQSANGTNRLPSGAEPVREVVIRLRDVRRLVLSLQGISELVINRMHEKGRQQILESGQAKKGKAKSTEPRDSPEVQMNNARHVSLDGWDGIHAGSFKGAIISAARFVDGLTMASLKAAVFIVKDGESESGTPLVKIDGKPRMSFEMGRTKTGQPKPMFRPMYMPWSCELTVDFNLHILGSVENCVNLVSLAGDCGVGDTRANAKESVTQSGGRWEVTGVKEVRRTAKSK